MRYCIPLSKTFGDQDIDCAGGEAMAAHSYADLDTNLF